MRQASTCTLGLLAALAAVPLTAPDAEACGPYAGSTMLDLVSPDEAIRREAIADFRGMGQSGLDLAVAHYRACQTEGVDADTLARLDRAIDAIAEQLDARGSGLFWHTDLDAALAASRERGKPVLSLRLLGRLTDERSCANSRFFRAILYRDPQVASFLRDGFVLHWSTERPVPEITIDFGDGRKLVRTITGNSCHYVLDSQGRVIDAVPGLYGPVAFVEALGGARNLFLQLRSGDYGKFVAYHQSRLDAIAARWERDLVALGLPAERLAAARAEVTIREGARRPTATEAMVISTSKSAAELPMLRRAMIDPFEALEDASTAPVWPALASRHAVLGRLSEASAAVVRAEAGPEHADAMLARLERSVALDTVRNELQLRRRIHQWLRDAPGGADFASFNARVYDELFRTPREDAWLGLFDAETFSALPGGGVVTR